MSWFTITSRQTIILSFETFYKPRLLAWHRCVLLCLRLRLLLGRGPRLWLCRRCTCWRTCWTRATAGTRWPRCWPTAWWRSWTASRRTLRLTVNIHITNNAVMDQRTISKWKSHWQSHENRGITFWKQIAKIINVVEASCTLTGISNQHSKAEGRVKATYQHTVLLSHRGSELLNYFVLFHCTDTVAMTPLPLSEKSHPSCQWKWCIKSSIIIP